MKSLSQTCGPVNDCTTGWFPQQFFVLILIHKFIIHVRVLCLIMLLVFGVFVNTQVLTMCIIELFASFWEFINLLEFWLLEEI